LATRLVMGPLTFRPPAERHGASLADAASLRDSPPKEQYKPAEIS
jgi:hypothetical protein